MASALWHASGSSFAASRAFVCFLLLLLPRATTECDQRFISIPDGPQNGTFHAPSLSNPDGESRQCVYTFFAGPHQRVELLFTSFGLRGTPPDCVHEFLDIYSEIRTDNATKLIDTPFGGRYCGPISPRKRVSLYQGIALSFYTDKNVTVPSLFSGRYAFINASEYEIGTPAPTLPCSFTVHSDVKRTGNIISPTYPGAYPKDLVCSYQFIGTPRQRVRLEFRDFDLFFGGPHCPFDYVKVYDGINDTAPVIGTYCGQQRNLVLYSSESNLFVLFVTLQRTANTQNRGFKGIFEFSESFVKLDFITNYGGEHIRGTECDQKILSKKESSGNVVSPNFPYPYIPKVVCRYFIYGMQDSQHLERVKLKFSTLVIPKGEAKGESSCTDGYLKIYLKGQEATDSYDKFDHELCGKDIHPGHVVSDGPRLVMVFSSGEQQGRGFKAEYVFETEYRIPGTAAPDGSCTFSYRSSSRKRGEFNSPRYPSNYPSDTNCTYLFLATPNEQVTIIFDHFKIRTKNFNITGGHYGVEYCQEDWVEVYNMYRDDTEKMIGRYCGMTAPGPVESTLGALGVKVILHTDSDLVYSGFKARYIFENAKSVFGDCGTNISSLHYGVITSPNFPNKYEAPTRGVASKTCNWFINVRPSHQILVNFELFSVEGEQAARGCPAAVLRMWISPHSTPVEMCGVKEPEDKWSHISDNHFMRLSFLSADKAVGQQGFRAIWTEVKQDAECRGGFLCERSGYCIDESLKCNNVDNCGPEDTSDEDHCVVAPPPENYYALPASSAIFATLAFLLLCAVCYRRLRRRGAPDRPPDDFHLRVDDCFHHHHHHPHHHNLLPHHHHHHHAHSRRDDEDDELDERGSLTGFAGDYRLQQQPSPPSDSDADLDDPMPSGRAAAVECELDNDEELADDGSSSPESLDNR
ncbi:dorsal-ventral patterning tolloid-like protein 1 isoform X2 [Phymastichus coffea]|uniref:dorsal-ventral patterning tolloid-like protein 1 isoform X2 n=1 Tax=Phymastichus coffea TaxID=108790 RepID=UPI00273C0F00|nr:dorsal-ventral patterning tolloid-like protein 1 isoform X2 [Phymastichus coffea]